MTFISILHDILLLIGYALTIYGAYQIYKPAAFVVSGLILLITFRPRIKNPIRKRNN